MRLHSKQIWYCTNCGTKQDEQMVHPGPYGKEWKCCGKECHDEIQWKLTLSIMGKEYHQRTTTVQ